jgi:hypothetical protein
MAGSKRNLPVVHTGNIALMPWDEGIPVRDWLAPPESNRVHYVKDYLVELNQLKGLSGSPVFVRPSFNLNNLALSDGEHIQGKVVQTRTLLLGVWQSSWDAPPDEIMALEKGKETRVPVGMGTVAPALELLKILELPALEELRHQADEKWRFHQSSIPDRSDDS